MTKQKSHLSVLIAVGILLMGSLPADQAISQVSNGVVLPDVKFDRCSIENQTFLDGERIVYKIFYQVSFIWMSAGEVVFDVKETPDHYHITVTGKTHGTYDWFYRVRDRYETYLDKETLLPMEFSQELEEGKYRRYDRYVFDQEARSVVAYKGKFKDQELKKRELEIGACMHDLISILYYVRNMDFSQVEAGQTFPIEVFLGKEYPLTVRILEKDVTKRVRGRGKYKTHLFSPELIKSEIFKEKDQMRIWISADDNKIPLLIESPLAVGKMKAVLKSHTQLRHEVAAKL